MAQTTLIPDTLLLVGEETHVSIAQSAELLSLRITAVQVGSAQSTIRVSVKDATGHIVDGTILNNGDSQDLLLDRISSALEVSLTCINGSARVTLLSITGADALGNQIQTADLAAGVLAASVLGRALMATGYFTEAKATDAFAALAITTGLLKAGILSADAAGRAKFADDLFTAAEFVAGAGGKFATDCMDAVAIANVLAANAFTAANVLAKFAAGSFDAAACASVFPAGAIPVAKVASAPFSLESVIADPGAAGAIPANQTGSVAITVAGVENRTLADPAAVGLCLSITHKAGAFAHTVTCASDITQAAGENVINFTAPGESIVLFAVDVGGAPKWRILANPAALVIN